MIQKNFMYAVVKGYHSTFLLEIGIYLHSCFFQKVQNNGLMQFCALAFLQLSGDDSMSVKMIQFPVYG